MWIKVFNQICLGANTFYRFIFYKLNIFIFYYFDRKNQQLKSSSSQEVMKTETVTTFKKSSTMELDRPTNDMAGRKHYRKQTKASHRGSAEILSSQTASTPSPPRTSSSPEGKSITSSQQSVIGKMDMMSTAESRTSLQTSGSNLTPPKSRAAMRPVGSPTSPSKSWDMQKRIGQKEMSARMGSYGHIESSSSRQPSHNGSSLRLPAAEGSMAVSLPVGGGRDSSLQQYLSKRQKEISSYMDSIRSQIPIPEEFTVHGKLAILALKTMEYVTCSSQTGKKLERQVYH